jgi:hydroxyquinol 1,2-dioxygenase
MTYKIANDNAGDKRPKLLPPRLRVTPPQVLGPYFLTDTPRQSRLFPQGATGSHIHIEGQVYSADLELLVGSVVHVWLADPSGRYDNQDAQGNPLKIPASKQVYRGTIEVGDDARFEFDCLRPGNYFNDGPGDAALWRPAHIHIMVEAPGYPVFVTQLYFEDDPQDDHDLPGKSFFQPELVVQMAPAIPVEGQIQRGIFNLVLAKP